MLSSSAAHLETPELDSEGPTLLHAITEHGGYAYVSMATLAAAGDPRAAEAAREIAWEQLHSGPWHSVDPVWRDAYSMACLHVARLHFSKSELSEALRVLDMGLIMGGTLLRKDLDSAVQKVSAVAGDASRVSEPRAERDVLRQVELDEAEVLQSLPVKSLSLKIVVKRPGLSLEGFLREYFLSGSPVIISDSMAHWPARTKWNDMDYLRRVAGDRTVPVEVGKNYLCPEWKQELITFSQFLARIEANDCSSADPTYLAQHPLFDQISELRKDICIPDYCFAGGGELRSLNAWFGPAGTVTPLHHDPHHNILAQVAGKKYIRLYPASLSEELYPYTETMLKNSSQVDLDNMDEIRFPKVHDLEFQDCILEEGRKPEPWGEGSDFSALTSPHHRHYIWRTKIKVGRFSFGPGDIGLNRG
ncbi:lysine-specific demethylase JMJ30 isoform X1 [Corylus avellana]|uniref:lysine-specific demethylase JMJ30 isoform X1 n=1 Tax=Corylus avellana TaxID=13451 RepID=UPI00286B15E3|nr:lysine-specific demethylase JMJ30 isoform X1 [Corylus avellana]